MNKLHFGTAGIPVSAKGGDTIDGIRSVRKLGLDSMELEFVRNVNISREKAPVVKKTAQDEGIVLTCHAPYYINLNSLEEKKIEESKKRILHSARIANLCGAYSMCFHPGFYMKMENQRVYDKIKAGIKEIVKMLKSEGNNIWIRPETTGKPTQFGSIEELVKISSELDGVLPCIDFSHLHARAAGKLNSYKEFVSILEMVEKVLGREALKNMHMHVSGIEYGPKGEKHHLNLEESDFKYKELLKAWKEFKIKGVVTSESPNIEEDALLMKKIYSDL